MSTSSGKNSLYWINTAISLFFMFIFGRIITPVEPLTAAGVQVLGIFIGLIWAWSTVDMAWPSIVGFIALGFPITRQLPQHLLPALVIMLQFYW